VSRQQNWSQRKNTSTVYRLQMHARCEYRQEALLMQMELCEHNVSWNT